MQKKSTKIQKTNVFQQRSYLNISIGMNDVFRLLEVGYLDFRYKNQIYHNAWLLYQTTHASYSVIPVNYIYGTPDLLGKDKYYQEYVRRTSIKKGQDFRIAEANVSAVRDNLTRKEYNFNTLYFTPKIKATVKDFDNVKIYKRNTERLVASFLDVYVLEGVTC